MEGNQATQKGFRACRGRVVRSGCPSASGWFVGRQQRKDGTANRDPYGSENRSSGARDGDVRIWGCLFILHYVGGKVGFRQLCRHRHSAHQKHGKKRNNRKKSLHLHKVCVGSNSFWKWWLDTDSSAVVRLQESGSRSQRNQTSNKLLIPAVCRVVHQS